MDYFNEAGFVYIFIIFFFHDLKRTFNGKCVRSNLIYHYKFWGHSAPASSRRSRVDYEDPLRIY